MTNTIAAQDGSKTNFAGMAGAKRRRTKSGGNSSKKVVPAASPEPSMDPSMDDDDDEEKTVQTSKCKGATTIPIFLKKTYKMIDSCDQSIASWTPEGDMFVVKDPDLFATAVIPQYFDHNKFSSFARQLNFYGFRKMQSKPIRNSDFDAGTAKHVTFYNENFKRGRCDLLKKIQRSTRGGGNNPGQDQQREVQTLRDQVERLENTVSDLTSQMEERMRRLELDMLGRMEQMMLAMQQHQQTQVQLQQQGPSSGASAASAASKSLMSAAGSFNGMGNAPGPGIRREPSLGGPGGWDPLPYGARATSMGSLGGFGMGPPGMSMPKNVGSSGPTLPPHPKQKSLPSTGLPGALGPPSRLTSLRGISNLSRGISNLSRGASIESASSVLLRNTWEDKFFSMLMLGEHENAAAAAQAAAQAAAAQGGNLFPTPMANGSAAANAFAAMVSNSSSIGQRQQSTGMNSVSSQDLA